MKSILFIVLILGVTGCTSGRNEDSTAQTASNIDTSDIIKAAARCDQASVEKQLKQGANINDHVGPDGERITPLLAATAQCSKNFRKFLISVGANVDANYLGYSSEEISEYSDYVGNNGD